MSRDPYRVRVPGLRKSEEHLFMDEDRVAGLFENDRFSTVILGLEAEKLRSPGGGGTPGPAWTRRSGYLTLIL